MSTWDWDDLEWGRSGLATVDVNDFLHSPEGEDALAHQPASDRLESRPSSTASPPALHPTRAASTSPPTAHAPPSANSSAPPAASARDSSVQLRSPPHQLLRAHSVGDSDQDHDHQHTATITHHNEGEEQQEEEEQGEEEHDFVTLDEFDQDDEDDDSDFITMPPRRQRPHGAPASSPDTNVDLTADSTATSPRHTNRRKRATRKRSVADTAPGPASKRRRKASRDAHADVEELDLTHETAEEELLQAQQQDAIKAQQADEKSGPQRIGKKSCIICMENYTNCTVTACGHLYCHECLVRALMVGAKNSDRNTGTCPMCRKPLSHTSKKKNDLIPISFMTKNEFDKRQTRRDRAGRAQ